MAPASGPAAAAGSGSRRDHGSPGSGAAMTARMASASSTEVAKILGQSSEAHAGTMPSVLTRPRLGLRPTVPVSAAGTRPEPAVSVPIATGTSPAATATAEPELDPPEISPGTSGDSQAPYGLRVPDRPVANWSRLVLPMMTAPAACSRMISGALSAGW